MSEKARYSFLSWLRQGFATQLQTVDQIGTSATAGGTGTGSTVQLRLQATGDGQEIAGAVFDKTIQLYGPGDVIGIASSAIIKTQPRAGVGDFEPNYFPYIEFYEEDFPWRYTPFAADEHQRLRPWLTLVVLEAGELVRDPIVQGDVLPSFTLTDAATPFSFPPAEQIWAWAHVQVNESLGLDNNRPTGNEQAQAVAELQRILQRNPNLSSSRLICPRKLQAQTEYFAFLIPSFERGRLAGLGKPTTDIQAAPEQAAAWGAGQMRFPYYYDWRFRTGEAEDFESLVKKIVGRQLDPQVGKRWIDIQAPGYGLHYVDPTPASETPAASAAPFMLENGAILMEGALRIPGTELPNLLQAPSAEKDEVYLRQLHFLLNLDEDMRQQVHLPADHPYLQNPYFPATETATAEDRPPIYDDPIVLPPIYGRWPAGIRKVASPDAEPQSWYNELNLDPRHRIAAGFGAEAVRSNQEDYVDRAWDQFEGLFAGNDYLRKMQFAEAVNQSVYRKHFLQMRTDQVVAISGGVQQVVRYDAQSSLLGRIHRSAVPDALMSPAAEKIASPNRTLMRRIHRATASTTDGVTTVQALPPDTLQMNLLSTPVDLTHINVPINLQTGGVFVFEAFVVRDTLKSRIEKALANRTGFLRISGVVDAEKSRFFTALEAFRNKGYLNTGATTQSGAALSFSFSAASQAILRDIDPKTALLKKINRQWQFGEPVAEAEPVEMQEIQPLVKAPTFSDPMSRSLIEINAAHLVPNLDLIPPNTAALMETNQAFIEAYLVGVNHEMARELLWREFPTDQRGSYFRRFWGSRDGQSQQNDIDPIHRWSRSLGQNAEHANAPSPGANELTERLVLVLRADLLRRFPQVIIYLQKAKKENNRYVLGTKIEQATFFAQVAPDIYFVGFDISEETARKGSGYFVVLRERPGELHFGLDLEPDPDGDPLTWDSLNWLDLTQVKQHIDLVTDVPPNPSRETIDWGFHNDGNAANMAWILQQKPVMVAIHLDEMLPQQTP